MTHNYRPELPPLPQNMRGLPEVRGYPVPWFVQWRDGVADFRVASKHKFGLAVAKGLCWVCGKALASVAREPFAFVIGPMCAINRTSSEPPSHLECATYSVQACPFLTRPHMERREDGLPEDTQPPAGFMLKRNPGVTLVWITRSYTRFTVPNGMLLRIGDPISVRAYCEGRPARNEELRASIESGLPALREAAKMSDGLVGLATLAAQKRVAFKVLGL